MRSPDSFDEESSSDWMSKPAPLNALNDSSSSCAILSCGMVSSSLLTWSSIGPTGCGTEASFAGITEPSPRYGPDLVRGTRSTNCSPTAEMLRMLACRSDGIFGEVFSDIVATAPSSVRSTDVTLPI